MATSLLRVLLLSCAIVATAARNLRPRRRFTPSPTDGVTFGQFFDAAVSGTAASPSAHRSLRLRLAVTGPQHEHGLMFRTSPFANGEGLGFLYAHEGKRALWMRNTEIPLDAAWFDAEGTFLELVRDMRPHDETWRWTQGTAASFGVEGNPGAFDDLVAGQSRLDMAAVGAAAAAQGEVAEVP